MKKYYTGVGSRKTPQNKLKQMNFLAHLLDQLGFILRTGDADGADKAFRDYSSQKEIYCAKDATFESMIIASKIHPNWEACSNYAKSLHGRNIFQVLGKEMDTPSDFLICWTPNGREIGGTRTSMVLAKENNIPVYNLYFDKDILLLLDMIEPHADIDIIKIIDKIRSRII